MFQPTLDVADSAPRGDGANSFNGFHPEPRCRVCRNDTVREKVNDGLVNGHSYAMIVRALEEDNSQLDANDRVSVDSVRRHCRRHFPVQNVAKATFREIMERRAQEAGVDFANGVATALTPAAVWEIIMVRGYETLMAADTEVDVQVMMAAAGKLQA